MSSRSALYLCSDALSSRSARARSEMSLMTTVRAGRPMYSALLALISTGTSLPSLVSTDISSCSATSPSPEKASSKAAMCCSCPGGTKVATDSPMASGP